MTKEVLKKMYQLLLTEPHAPTLCEKLESIAREALTQPEQEPVAWIEKDIQCDDFYPDSVTFEKPAIAADGWEWIPLYTTPPQRQWVDLTDEEVEHIADSEWEEAFVRLIEAKLKEKNT
jgi:hypothetical protein